MINLRQEFKAINRLCFGSRLKSIPLGYARIWSKNNKLFKRGTPGAKEIGACFVPDIGDRCIIVNSAYKNDLWQVLGMMTHEMLHYDLEVKYGSGAHDKRFNDRFKIIWRKVQRANEDRMMKIYIKSQLNKVKDPGARRAMRQALKNMKVIIK